MKCKKQIIAVMLIISLFAVNTVAVFAALPGYGEEYANQPSTSYSQIFHDVNKNHWAFEYIMEMNSRGVLSGYPNGNFYPENTITRAEFAKIMCLAAGLKVSAVYQTSYSDVETSAWYAPYVETGKYYLSGYISGEKSYYKPDSNALREDIAVALVKLKGYDTSVYDESILKVMFTDWQSISEGARKYVAVAVEKGLISGYEDNTFRGQATLTRAEASTLMWRAYQYGSENKVFDEKTENEQKEEVMEKEPDPLVLSLSASKTSYTVEEGESVEIKITVSANEEGEYIPEVDGDTDILSGKPDVSTKGNNTICEYETDKLEAGEYELSFKIKDDAETHKKTVKITVEEPDPLTLSLSASKTSYTVEEGESVEFKITVSANEEGEYIPEVDGDTDILSGEPDVSTKGNNTICEYETDELKAGKYELIFSIKDASKTHEKKIKITVEEPEPEYTYEMDTVVKNVNGVFQMVSTESGFVYWSRSENKNDNDTIYEYDGTSTRPIFRTEEVGYLGEKELSKAELAWVYTDILGIGFNPNDHCVYAFIKNYEEYYIYNATDDCIYMGLDFYYDTDSYVKIEGYNDGRGYYEINFDNENNLYINDLQVLTDRVLAKGNGWSTYFFLEDTLCEVWNYRFYRLNIRTGKMEEIDYYTGNSSTPVCANDKYAFLVAIEERIFDTILYANEIYTVDLNGDSELLCTIDDIDNVDRKVINFENIKREKSVASNDDTIYFYDEDYDSIRCIRKKQ